jgi:hypothetical protein
VIEKLTVSIIPYSLPELKEEDIEDLKNFIVQVAQLGFEGTIDNRDIPRKDNT